MSETHNEINNCFLSQQECHRPKETMGCRLSPQLVCVFHCALFFTANISNNLYFDSYIFESHNVCNKHRKESIPMWSFCLHGVQSRASLLFRCLENNRVRNTILYHLQNSRKVENWIDQLNSVWITEPCECAISHYTVRNGKGGLHIELDCVELSICPSESMIGYAVKALRGKQGRESDRCQRYICIFFSNAF